MEGHVGDYTGGDIRSLDCSSNEDPACYGHIIFIESNFRGFEPSCKCFLGPSSQRVPASRHLKTPSRM